MNHPHDPRISVSYENHKAIVSFRCPVEPLSISDLVETLRNLINTFYYTRIELHIHSPGGSVSSLKYYVTAMLSWQDKGVKFTTRALSDVASASAVMLSLGDDRTASLQSELLYHHARLLHAPTPLTADHAARIGRDLDRTDNYLISLLAHRALRIDPESWEARWRDNLPTTSPDAAELSPSAHHLSSNSAFATEASQAFRESVRDAKDWRTTFWDPENDKSTRLAFLEEVYRTVFRVDLPIPPLLARRIGHHRPSHRRLPPSAADPERTLTSRRDSRIDGPPLALHFADGHITRAELTRHS